MNTELFEQFEEYDELKEIKFEKRDIKVNITSLYDNNTNNNKIDIFFIIFNNNF